MDDTTLNAFSDDDLDLIARFIRAKFGPLSFNRTTDLSSQREVQRLYWQLGGHDAAEVFTHALAQRKNNGPVRDTESADAEAFHGSD